LFDIEKEEFAANGDTLNSMGQAAVSSTLTLSLTPSLLQRTGAKQTTNSHHHSLFPGGWKPEGPLTNMSSNISEQIDQAFANVDLTLRTAGGKGWSQVFRITSYHVPLGEEAMGAMVRNFRKWMPDHEPLWTTIGVARLGDEHMLVEIEVAAHDPEGAKKAAAAEKA